MISTQPELNADKHSNAHLDKLVLKLHSLLEWRDPSEGDYESGPHMEKDDWDLPRRIRGTQARKVSANIRHLGLLHGKHSRVGHTSQQEVQLEKL